MTTDPDKFDHLRLAAHEITCVGCPCDTNGDGDCGRPLCPYCGPDGALIRIPALQRKVTACNAIGAD